MLTFYQISKLYVNIGMNQKGVGTQFVFLIIKSIIIARKLRVRMFGRNVRLNESSNNINEGKTRSGNDVVQRARQKKKSDRAREKTSELSSRERSSARYLAVTNDRHSRNPRLRGISAMQRTIRR